MILELIETNAREILICVFIFLNGVGIGAAITDAINGIGEKKNEKHNDSDT